MRADRNDTPAYLRKKNWQNNAKKWMNPTLAGIAVEVGTLHSEPETPG